MASTVITASGIFSNTVTVDEELIDGLAEGLNDNEFGDNEVILAKKIKARLDGIQSQIDSISSNPGTPGNVRSGLSIDDIRNQLGTMAQQNRGAVTISGGAITGVAVEDSDIILKDMIIAGSVDQLLTTTAGTAVREAIIYDTALDDDFGAWVERTDYTSWHTNTRGPFPRVVYITAQNNSLIIWDATGPGITRWMDFTTHSSNYTYLGASFTPTCISAKNGIIAIGHTTGALIIDFIEDAAYRISGDKYKFGGDIETSRNANTASPILVESYSSNSLTSVKFISVYRDYDNSFPNLIRHPITKTRIPRIILGNDSSFFVDLDHNKEATFTSYAGETFQGMDVNHQGDLYILSSGGGERFQIVRHINKTSSAASDRFIYSGINNSKFKPSITTTYQKIQATKTGAVYGPDQDGGLVFVHDQKGDDATENLDETMFCSINTYYTTGWCPFNTKFISMVGQNNFNDLMGTVTGTRTLNNVPLVTSTTKDSITYGPFSTANFLSINNLGDDIQFGVNDFTIMFWVRKGTVTDNNGEAIFTFGQSAAGNTYTGASIRLHINAAGIPILSAVTSTSLARNVTLFKPISDNDDHLIMITRRGTKLHLYVDEDNETTDLLETDSFTNAQGDLYIGKTLKTTPEPFSGYISLLRIVTQAVTPTQHIKILRDEKALHGKNTKFYFSGSLRNIKYDRGSDLVTVSATQGIFTYQGLVAIRSYDHNHANLTNRVSQAAYCTHDRDLLTTQIEAVAFKQGDRLANSIRKLLAVMAEKEELIDGKMNDISASISEKLSNELITEDQITALIKNSLIAGTNITFSTNANGSRNIHGPSLALGNPASSLLTLALDNATKQYTISIHNTRMAEMIRDTVGSLIRGDRGVTVENSDQFNTLTIRGPIIEAGNAGDIKVSAFGAVTDNAYTITGPNIVAGNYLSKNYAANTNTITLSGAIISEGSRSSVDYNASTNTWVVNAPDINIPNAGQLKYQWDNVNKRYQIRARSVEAGNDSVFIEQETANAFNGAFSAKIHGPVVVSGNDTTTVTHDTDPATHSSKFTVAALSSVDISAKAGYSVSGVMISLETGRFASALIPRDTSIKDIYLKLEEAPTGTSNSSVDVDVHVNGVSVFSSGKKPSLTGTTVVAESSDNSIEIIDASKILNAGDLIEFFIDAVGSSNRGKGLHCTLQINTRTS